MSLLGQTPEIDHIEDLQAGTTVKSLSPGQAEMAEPSIKFIPYDSPPEPISPITPNYPVTAIEAGFEGTVVIMVFINKEGEAKELVIVKGVPDSELDQAAIKAIKAVKFKPAMKNKSAIGVWVAIPVSFKLNNFSGKIISQNYSYGVSVKVKLMVALIGILTLFFAH